MKKLSLEMIGDARLCIQQEARKTPLEYSPKLSELLSVPVYLKLEFLQKTGSFKLRGALYKLSCLNESERMRGVVTCSAGNHGKAVAYVAKKLGIKATIYVPSDVDETKYQGILSYGAEVIRGPFAGYDDTEALAKKEADELRKTFISPYDDVEVMAANGGTIAVELFEDLPDAHSVILPVGGGGLAAGLSFYAKETKPHTQIIGCQHIHSPALKLSLEKGCAFTQLPPIQTAAGGIEGGLGANCFTYLQSRIDAVALAEENEILKASRWMLEHHQYLVEPSSAVTIACCLNGQIKKLSSPAAIVLTGRNVSLSTICV